MRVLGFVMYVVSAVSVFVAGKLAWAAWLMAEAGLVRQGAKLELIVVLLCGVVLPLGIGALILKKNPAK